MKTKFLFAITAMAVSVAIISCSKSGGSSGGGSSTPSPVANFTVSAVGANTHAPATMDFSNTSSNAGSYSWNFGDGTTSTSSSPSHKYATAGNYTVTLTASSAGKTSTKSQTVTIANPYLGVDLTHITLTSSTQTTAFTGFFRISNSSNGQVWKSANLTITPSALPVTWALTTPVTFSISPNTFYIEVWKYGIVVDTKVASTPFITSIYAVGANSVNSYPTSITGLEGIGVKLYWWL